MSKPSDCTNPTRRDLLRWGAVSATLAGPLGRALQAAEPARGPRQKTLVLADDWTLAPADASAAAQSVTLPHAALKLSWEGWDPKDWAKLYHYTRSFASPVEQGSTDRVFLRFHGTMSGATPIVNGHAFEKHLGGFLPWEREITEHIAAKNELVVAVDGNWLNTPPSGSPKGPQQVDYLLPAAIHREVVLRVVPHTFLDEVFVKPVDVLSPNRSLEIQCIVDAASAPQGPMHLEAKVSDSAGKIVAKAKSTIAAAQAGRSEARCTVKGLGGVELWSPDSPKLYNVVLTLFHGRDALHEYTTRIGFREAKFTVDGFFLNGKKTRIFGLNRHELFPYTGFAMPERVMRRDAEILKRELNLNTVRCSHYPQSEHFLDACDELGLMVWEEIPGWQYIGDDAWKKLLLRDIRDMVVRDRNRPSIIVWGVRVNESKNDPPLYEATTRLAKSLDDTRACSGTMTHEDLPGWNEDLYAYDDYHNGPNGKLAMHKPIPGVPFLFAEAVGQFGYEHGGEFRQFYRRSTGALDVLEGQSKWHAQGHDKASEDPHVAGLIAWCAFDYASLVNGYKAMKCPGVLDTFRVPKLGATFYQSQVAPSVKPIILPSFYWDFSNGSRGPGKEAYIWSNCDRLLVSVGGGPTIEVIPDRKNYPRTAYPPFVVDLSSGRPGDELAIEGFVGARSVLTKRMSSDRAKDKLLFAIDDAAIANDGVDLTRAWFLVTDAHGAQVRCLDGEVSFSISGPADIVGDRSIALADSGGAGAIWIRGKQGEHGVVTVHATHPKFGTQTASLDVKASART